MNEVLSRIWCAHFCAKLPSVLYCNAPPPTGGKVRTMKTYYVYCKGKPIEVDHEVYQAITQLTNQVYYHAHMRGECAANYRQRAVWCDGDCHMCRYYVPKAISADWMAECGHEVAHVGALDDWMVYRCEDTIADMARVDPMYGERIGRMIMDGWQIVDIAAVLDIPVSTLRDRLRRIGRRIRGV